MVIRRVTGSGAFVPPSEHPERAEGVPAARSARAPFKMEVHAARVDVVECAQHVVVPVVRERELRILRLDEGPGALASAAVAVDAIKSSRQLSEAVRRVAGLMASCVRPVRFQPGAVRLGCAR